MEIKRTTDGLRKNLCELEDISQKPAKKQNTEKQRKKKKTLNKTKQNIQELCDNYKESNIHVIRTGKEREKEKEEIFETIQLTTASKRINYLGINLTKKMKDLYNETYNMLTKETEEDINEWRHILCMDWKN